MEKIGTQNLKNAVLLLAALANAGDAIGHETGWKQRGAELLALIPLLKQASSIDFKKVMPELKDIDATERAELLKSFNEQFKIEDSKLEASIEKGLDAVADLIVSISKVYDFVGELKGDVPKVAGEVASNEPAVDPATGEMAAGANQAAINAPKTSEA